MIVISPAKRLSNKACNIILNATTPIFKKAANLLEAELAKLNASIAVCKTAESAYITALKDQISE